MPSKTKHRDNLKVNNIDACNIKTKTIEADFICVDKVYGDIPLGATGPTGPKGAQGNKGDKGPTGPSATVCYNQELSFGATQMYKTNPEGVISSGADVLNFTQDGIVYSVIGWRFVNHETNQLNWQTQLPMDIDTTNSILLHLHFYVKFITTADPVHIILHTITASDCNDFRILEIYNNSIELPCGQTNDVFFSHVICIDPLQFNMVSDTFHQFALNVTTDDLPRETYVLAAKLHFRKLQNCNPICQIGST